METMLLFEQGIKIITIVLESIIRIHNPKHFLDKNFLSKQICKSVCMPQKSRISHTSSDLTKNSIFFLYITLPHICFFSESFTHSPSGNESVSFLNNSQAS